MFENLDVFRTAIAMARHAGTKQALSAQNIANADTPQYRAREIADFATTLTERDSSLRASRPEHLFGVSAGSDYAVRERKSSEDPNGNSVSLEQEMVVAVDAKRAHDRALAIYRSNMMLLRASLGR